MILTTLSEEQIGARYAMLPPNLVGVLNAPSTKSATDAIGKEFGLGENQTTVLEIIVSLVFMGLLHPDMVAGELKETFGLDEAKAKDIGLKLNADVFALYRADIEKVYMPAPPEGPAPAVAQSPTLDLSKPPAPLPAIPAAPTSVPLTPTAAGMKMSSLPGAPPAPAAPAAAPRPFILQKETSAQPAAVSPNFRLNLNTKMFSAAAGAPSAPPPPPPRPAELEIGQSITKKETLKTVSAPAPAPKVVHYTDFKSSLGIPAAPPKTAPAPPPTAPKAAVPAPPAAKNSNSTPVPLTTPFSGAVDLRPSAPPSQVSPGEIWEGKPTAPAPASVPVRPAASSFIRNAPGVPPPAKPDSPAPAPLPAKPAGPPNSVPPQK